MNCLNVVFRCLGFYKDVPKSDSVTKIYVVLLYEVSIYALTINNGPLTAWFNNFTPC